jgi:hypothetical protein
MQTAAATERWAGVVVTAGSIRGVRGAAGDRCAPPRRPPGCA